MSEPHQPLAPLTRADLFNKRRRQAVFLQAMKQLPAVIHKELLIEFRQPSRLLGILVFGLLLVLIVGIASPSTASFRQFAAATLWLALTLASTRSLDQSYQVEFEHGAMEGMVLWPVDPLAIYYGKAIANTLTLFIVCVGITPVLLAMADASIEGNVGMFFAFLLMGSAGLAAPGTTFGLMAAQARGSAVLLPLLLIPLLVPMLLAGARGTMLVMQGGPGAEMEAPGWLQLLMFFNLLHWSLGGVFYGLIIED